MACIGVVLYSAMSMPWYLGTHYGVVLGYKLELVSGTHLLLLGFPWILILGFCYDISGFVAALIKFSLSNFLWPRKGWNSGNIGRMMVLSINC